MGKIRFDKDINIFGELSDSISEEEFSQQFYKKVVNYIKLVVLSLGILNTLFLIPDCWIVQNHNSLLCIISSRILFILLIFLLYFSMDYISTFRMFSYIITAYEITCILLFIFILIKYESPDYLIQSYGVMVIILAIFLVPNRWIYKILVSLFIIIGFNLLSVKYIDSIRLKELLSVILYSVIVLILSSINSFRDNYYKRVQFINNIELIRLSTTDPLTGVYNRVKLNEEFNRCIEYCKRYNTPISLIMVDFDNFKKINDTFGHITGDNVILDFVSIVRNNIRDFDILARWGGEEFVILLPNTDIEYALIIAERLRKKIEAYIFKEVSKVTCSLGVAQSSCEDNIDSLIQKADKMLYIAKSNGKNIVMGYSTD